jgi:hypothetical protein
MPSGSEMDLDAVGWGMRRFDAVGEVESLGIHGELPGPIIVERAFDG